MGLGLIEDESSNLQLKTSEVSVDSKQLDNLGEAGVEKHGDSDIDKNAIEYGENLKCMDKDCCFQHYRNIYQCIKEWHCKCCRTTERKITKEKEESER